MNLKLFGTFVKAMRFNKGLTIAQLSTRANVSIAAISRIESGHADPTLTTVSKLATGFGYSLTELFGEFGAVSRNPAVQQLSTWPSLETAIKDVLDYRTGAKNHG